MSTACQECGAPLAPDQRYCVSCGARVAPRPPRLAPVAPLDPLGEAPARASAARALPSASPPRVLALRAAGHSGFVRLPSGRIAAVLAAGMLASGILIGAAVGPVATGTSAAAGARKIVAVMTGAPAPPVATPTAGSGDTSGQAGSSSLDSLLSGPTASTPPTSVTPPAASAPTSSSGAPAAAPAAAGSTTADSTTTGSTPTGSGSTPTGTGSTTPAPPPPKLNRQGVVVALDSASQSFYVADSRHRLFEVHSSDIPGVGTKLRLATRSLANGTLAGARTVKVKGPAAMSVTADGVVSFVDSSDASYTLSVRGVSLLIDASSPSPATALTAAPTTTAPAATSPLPSVGQRLEVVLALPKPGAGGVSGTLREIHRSPLSPPDSPLRDTPKQPLELAGVLTAYDQHKRTATISADGGGLSAGTISLAVPATIKLGSLALPEAVVVHATFAAGAYELTGLAGDSDATAARARKQELGDFAPKRRP